MSSLQSVTIPIPTQAKLPYQAEDHESGITPLLDETPEESRQKQDNWLSSQFQQLPYQIYICWLAISFLIVLTIEYLVIESFWSILKKGSQLQVGFFTFGRIILCTGLVFSAYGCLEMIFAVVKRNSKMAQKSVMKFQYSLIMSIIGSPSAMESQVFQSYSSHPSLIRFLICSVLIMIPLVHLIGGFAVLRVFKKGHPLARLQNSIKDQEVLDPLERDFLEQNELIASELLKYDERLNRWPYLVYQCWLKFAIIFDIVRLCACVIAIIESILKEVNRELLEQFFALAFLSVVTAYSCFQMDIVMKTKIFEKLKRAIFLLKICVIVGITVYLFVIQELILNRRDSDSESYILYVFWFLYCFLIPVITLLGTLNLHKLLGQRDMVARASSYFDQANL